MRIISGEFRGRRLLSPVGLTTRPITDRVKLALFNILTPRLEGAEVADLFCGTGSLGLEALSRGAGRCWFADRDASAIELLRRNIETLGLGGRCTVWRGDVARELSARLAGLPEKLDLVFVDPPYALADEWAGEAQEQAVRDVFAPLAGALADDGLLVLRTRRDLPSPERLGPFALARRKEYGSMALSFLAPQRV